MATQPLVTASKPDYSDDSRWERIEGHWVERPVPTAKHSIVQGNVVEIVRPAARALGLLAGPEWSVTQSESAERGEPQYMTPDFLVVPRPYRQSRRGHCVPPAFLAIEIASPGQGDLIEKATRYLAWGVEHCWLIYPDTRTCLEYHGGNTITIAGDHLTAGKLQVATVDLFAGLDELA